MSEEVPFRSTRVTLSEEAMERLNELTKMGSFRSQSMVIEESVRAIYDLVLDIYTVLGRPGDASKSANVFECAQAYRRLVMRLSRFSGVLPTTEPTEKK